MGRAPNPGSLFLSVGSGGAHARRDPAEDAVVLASVVILTLLGALLVYVGRHALVRSLREGTF
jgi:hypothetical protein